MPETKINIQSPFYKRYSATDLAAVVLDVYIYSGEKDTDKGTVKYTLVKEALDGQNHVIFELSDLIKDYLEPTKAEPFNSNIDYVKWVQLNATLIIDGLVAEDISVSTNKNTEKVVNMIGRDELGKAFTYQIVDNPTNGTLGTVNGNVVTYDPNENYTGADSFTYKIVRTEDSKESGVATVSVTVDDTVPDTTILFRYRRNGVDFKDEDSIECANQARIDAGGVYTGYNFGIYDDYEVGAKLLAFNGDTLTSGQVTLFTGFLYVIDTDSPNGVEEMVELGLDGDGDFAILDLQEVSNIGACSTLTAVSLAGPTTLTAACSETNFATFYHDGAAAIPAVGDVIYTDSAGANFAAAGYYKISGQDKRLQIPSTDGEVDNIVDCT